MPRLGRVAAVMAVAFSTIAIVAPEPAQADTEVVANWQMNEGSSASTMNDSGPYGIDGQIGDDVITNYSIGGATGYRWLYKRPNEFPPEPERLITVPHHELLNPGSGDSAVEFRYRTDKNFGNIIQKGQSRTNGGYFKFENPQGKMRCLFKDATGDRRAVSSPESTNDGQWHTIRCEKTSNMLRLYVDGVKVRDVSHSLGSMGNNWDLAIAGKLDCNQFNVTCDYFTGDLDYIRIEKEGASTAPPPPSGGEDISHVGSNSETANSSSHDVDIPSVQSGDLLILFATSAGSASIGNPMGSGDGLCLVPPRRTS